MVEAAVAAAAANPTSIAKKALDAMVKNIQPPPEINYSGVRQLGEPGANGVTIDKANEVQKHAISEHYKGHNLANVLRAIVHVVFYITLIVGLATIGPTIAKILDWLM